MACPENRFQETLRRHDLTLLRASVDILQINLGRLCNLACSHCHVGAGPRRREVMGRPTIDRILDWLARFDVPRVDLTGGEPEMIPDFRYLVSGLRSLRPPRTIMLRTNLAIMTEPGYECLPSFLKRHAVEVIGSLPCYTRKNVDAQRGKGVFEASIRALRMLNREGYGRDSGLPLHLVYNPGGVGLPGRQAALEADYRCVLAEGFGLCFNRLYTMANVPIARFGAALRRSGELEAYEDILRRSFNAATVESLMCRNTLSVGWRGEVYDCDFNQQLGMQWRNGRPLFLWDVDPRGVEGRAVLTGDHCFACTAGAGSSCGGALAHA